MENDNLIIYGKNTVTEAIKSGKTINTVYVQKGSNAFRQPGLVVKEVTAEKLNSLSEGNRHGGVVAVLSAVEYCSVEDIIAGCKNENENGKPFLLIADGIEDPHNLGALIRTAEAAGVSGVVIPKRRGVQVTGAVYAASAGAAAHMKIARVTNLVDTIKTLKSRNIWVYGAQMDGIAYSKADFSGNGGAALVIGSEGRGLSRLVRENCDMIISVAMFGKINSLNASVCGGILMFAMAECVRGGI
jgi:23S rRNA (guanosine2251-2'-O)-methyltransferase